MCLCAMVVWNGAIVVHRIPAPYFHSKMPLASLSALLRQMQRSRSNNSCVYGSDRLEAGADAGETFGLLQLDFDSTRLDLAIVVYTPQTSKPFRNFPLSEN